MKSFRSKKKSVKGKGRLYTELTGRANPATGKNAGADLLVRREERLDIVNTPQAIYGYPLNPMDYDTFTALPAIASRYETYQIEELSFHYIASVSSYVSGSVIMAIDYDCLDALPANQDVMANYPSHVETKVSENVVLVASKAMCNKIPWHYCGSTTNPKDLKTYNVGTLFVSSSGDVHEGVGRIVMRYAIRFSGPTIEVPASQDLAFTAPINASRAPLHEGLANAAALWQSDTVSTHESLGDEILRPLPAWTSLPALEWGHSMGDLEENLNLTTYGHGWTALKPGKFLMAAIAQVPYVGTTRNGPDWLRLIVKRLVGGVDIYDSVNEVGSVFPDTTVLKKKSPGVDPEEKSTFSGLFPSVSIDIGDIVVPAYSPMYSADIVEIPDWWTSTEVSPDYRITDATPGSIRVELVILPTPTLYANQPAQSSLSRGSSMHRRSERSAMTSRFGSLRTPRSVELPRRYRGHPKPKFVEITKTGTAWPATNVTASSSESSSSEVQKKIEELFVKVDAISAKLQ